MSSSSSPPPRLTLTQAISCQRHLNTATTAPTPWPLQLPPCHPLQGAEHPLDSLSHMCHRHTQATLLPSPSLCLVHLKKASDKSFPFFSPLSLTVQDTSPRHRPIALPMACKHPPHLPLHACRPPFRHHCHHNHHHLNASMTSATSPTPSPYNWLLFAARFCSIAHLCVCTTLQVVLPY